MHNIIFFEKTIGGTMGLLRGCQKELYPKLLLFSLCSGTGNFLKF